MRFEGSAQSLGRIEYMLNTRRPPSDSLMHSRLQFLRISGTFLLEASFFLLTISQVSRPEMNVSPAEKSSLIPVVLLREKKRCRGIAIVLSHNTQRAPRKSCRSCRMCEICVYYLSHSSAKSFTSCGWYNP